MSGANSFQILSKSPETTAQLARLIATEITAPCVVLLSGGIGAGKSAFARAFLRACGVTDQDIPSPTFTLVQTYDSPRGAIWHADLYRLSGIDDVDELGLLDAFETDICLVEWPDRLQDETPSDAIRLDFETTAIAGERKMTITGPGDAVASLKERCAL